MKCLSLESLWRKSLDTNELEAPRVSSYPAVLRLRRGEMLVFLLTQDQAHVVRFSIDCQLSNKGHRDVLLSMKTWPLLRLVPSWHLKLKLARLHESTFCHITYLSPVSYVRLLPCQAGESWVPQILPRVPISARRSAYPLLINY